MSWFGPKVARLPNRGVLIAATDLQGNLKDYRALKVLYEEEEEKGNEPFLLLCGDLVHGPGPDLADPRSWPEHLGTHYLDRSAQLLIDFEEWSQKNRATALLGNHEHSHIGGPRVSKFHTDEAAVLDAALGQHRERMQNFIRTWPLIAVSHAGAVFTHGAPRMTESSLEEFDKLRFDGFDDIDIGDMYRSGTVGALLWARGASSENAQALLAATSLDDSPAAFVGYGHDVVSEGYEKVGAEQICFSTSFGLFDTNKVYLRLDLTKRYQSVHDLKDGAEILPLYPNAEP
jgi:hypothetical protein